MTKNFLHVNDLSKNQPALTKELAALWYQFAKNSDNLSQKQRRPVSNKSQPWRKRG